MAKKRKMKMRKIKDHKRLVIHRCGHVRKGVSFLDDNTDRVLDSVAKMEQGLCPECRKSSVRGLSLESFNPDMFIVSGLKDQDQGNIAVDAYV